MPSFRNLVFKGGGVRGIAYLGAIEYLYTNGLMRSVERTAGTSAGAITATVIALNLGDFEHIKSISDSLDYRKVPAEGEPYTATAKPLTARALAAKARELAVFKSLQCSVRLVQEKGWYSSDYFYAWLKSIIAKNFVVAKEGYTFRDFRNASIHVGKRQFFDLYITGTDISNRTSRVFSYETTPDMEVALAVRISMSIPIFFESVPFQYPGTPRSQFYADGGVMWNFPINIFDNPKYGKKFSKGINTETLGFFIYASPDSTDYKEVKGIVDYVGALFESLLLVQEQLVLNGEKNRGRTIFIDDAGVPSTNFDIVSGDATYRRLYVSGYEAAKGFFSEKTNWGIILHKIQTKFGWKGSEY